MKCTRSKEPKAEKKNKYFGGVFCPQCFKRKKDAVWEGQMPPFRNLIVKPVDGHYGDE